MVTQQSIYRLPVDSLAYQKLLGLGLEALKLDETGSRGLLINCCIQMNSLLALADGIGPILALAV